LDPGNHVLDGVQISYGKGQLLGEEEPIVNMGTFCNELYKNGWTGRFAVWIVASGGPKEAQVQSCSTSGANVPTWEGDAVLCQVNLANRLFYRPLKVCPNCCAMRSN